MDCVISETHFAAERTDMAGITAAVLEERVNNHIKFFWAVTAVLSAGLVAGGWMLADIRGDVKVLMIPQKLSKIAESPTNAKSQKEATTTLATIREKSIPVPVTLISSAGNQFVRASANDSGAWPIALQFASYRSSLNKPSLSLLSAPLSPFLPFTNHFDVGEIPEGKNGPRQAQGVPVNVVPTSVGTAYENIGQNLNDKEPAAFSEIALYGGALNIDGKHIRNFTFIGIEIHYSGKPVVLENVSFINCTFVFDNTDKARQLAQEVLTSATVNFPKA